MQFDLAALRVLTDKPTLTVRDKVEFCRWSETNWVFHPVQSTAQAAETSPLFISCTSCSICHFSKNGMGPPVLCVSRS